MLNSLLARAGDTLSRAAAREPMIVLTVALAFRNDDSMVLLTLTPDTPTGVAPRWEIPFSSFKGAHGFVLPEALLRLMSDSLHLGTLPQSGGVIWLRLVRPYGFLGLVPWEDGLRATLKRPVLRLPDFPARAAERTDVLENVVIIDPPNNPQLAAAVQARLDALLAAILAGTSRADTKVHVFCSARWHRWLRVDGADERICFWAPGRAPQNAGIDGTADLALWTDWILDKVAGRGIDAVHLIGRAVLGDAEGSYLMSRTPFEAAGLVPDIEVDLEALSLLLGRAGAWSVSFMPVAAEYRDSVAYVADGLAHRWPGAVLFQANPDGEALNVAAKLLYSAAATAPPRFADGFLYCQPAFVSAKQRPLALALAEILGQQAVLLAARAPATERMLSWVTRVLPGIKQVQQSAPPAWLGATQRFLESEVFDGIRRGASDVLMSAAFTPEAGVEQRVEFSKGTEDVLKEMRSVVERYLKQEREATDDGPISNS